METDELLRKQIQNWNSPGIPESNWNPTEISGIGGGV